jgi:hypothetical protein
MNEKESGFEALAASPTSRAYGYRAASKSGQRSISPKSRKPRVDVFGVGVVVGAIGVILAAVWMVSTGLQDHAAQLPHAGEPVSHGVGIAALAGKALFFWFIELVAHL